jgi:hypothetical protein
LSRKSGRISGQIIIRCIPNYFNFGDHNHNKSYSNRDTACRTEREEAEDKEREQQLDQELESLLEDDFMQIYMQKRMQEMMNITRADKK